APGPGVAGLPGGRARRRGGPQRRVGVADPQDPPGVGEDLDRDRVEPVSRRDRVAESRLGVGDHADDLVAELVATLVEQRGRLDARIAAALEEQSPASYRPAWRNVRIRLSSGLFLNDLASSSFFFW